MFRVFAWLPGKTLPGSRNPAAYGFPIPFPWEILLVLETTQDEEEFSRNVRTESNGPVGQLLAGTRAGQQSELIVHPRVMISDAIRRHALDGGFLMRAADHVPGPAQGMSLSIHASKRDIGFTANNGKVSATPKRLIDAQIGCVQFRNHGRALRHHGHRFTVG